MNMSVQIKSYILLRETPKKIYSYIIYNEPKKIKRVLLLSEEIHPEFEEHPIYYFQ